MAAHYTPNVENSIPVPVEPAVLSVHLVNSVAETNVPVSIPWKNCKLTHVRSVVLEAIDATGDMVVDLELNAAAGTAMGTLTVAASSAVGDVDTVTLTASACAHLSRTDESRDAINFEIDGSAAAAGSIMVYMYFEVDPAN